MYRFVLGRIHHHPELHAAHGPQVGHPCPRGHRAEIERAGI